MIGPVNSINECQTMKHEYRKGPTLMTGKVIAIGFVISLEMTPNRNNRTTPYISHSIVSY
jgi:hypothetical protein